MRVLQVCESFGGGNFSSVTQICNGLARRGHEVHLAYSRRPETPADFSSALDAAVILHEIRMTRAISPWIDLRALIALIALIRVLDPQVIHLHSSKAGFLGRAAALVSGRIRSVLYSPRGLSFLQQDVSARRRKFFRWLEWLAARPGGTVVACSSGELDQIRQCIRPKDALLIENAVDVGMVRRKVNRADGRVRIGTAGRISFPRNPGHFMRVARELAHRNVDFVWIGGGNEADATELARCGVEVTGWLTRTDALERLSQLDIYLQTSLWEGMPMAVIEAQVAGIPAIVTDVLGNRDVVVNDETGYICGTVREMVDRLSALAADEGAREGMGARARALALGRFSVDRMLEELTSAYAERAA